MGNTHGTGPEQVRQPILHVQTTFSEELRHEDELVVIWITCLLQHELGTVV